MYIISSIINSVIYNSYNIRLRNKSTNKKYHSWTNYSLKYIKLYRNRLNPSSVSLQCSRVIFLSNTGIMDNLDDLSIGKERFSL